MVTANQVKALNGVKFHQSGSNNVVESSHMKVSTYFWPCSEITKLYFTENEMHVMFLYIFLKKTVACTSTVVEFGVITRCADESAGS